MAGIEWANRALVELAGERELREQLDTTAQQVRDRARSNAMSISPRLVGAIATESGSDSEGAFADVGYDRNHPGFVLWWHEVGTVNYPATPHLRPALRPGD